MGWPGWTFDPSAGRPVVIGGRAGTLTTADAREPCLGIGGALEITVVIPRSAPDNWMELDACLAGPDTGPAFAQVVALLASVSWKG